MVKQLSGLISDTIRRSIIVNGKLVTYEGSVVYTKMTSNYVIAFFKYSQNHQEILIPDGEKLLEDIGKKFNEKYGSLVNGSALHTSHFESSIDTFTQSVVMKNGLYDFLMDQYDSSHLHDGQRQFQEGAQKLIYDFVCETIENYLEIYLTLMNRKLMGGHMPPIIKGHLVSGLFQPLVVQSRHVFCPLKFGEFQWFLDYLERGTPTEEYLERGNDTNRGLDLSVIAMSDISKKFGTPIVKELTRAEWLFILYLSLIRFVDLDGEAIKRFSTHFIKLYMSLDQDTGTPGARDFMREFYRSVREMRTKLTKVR